MSLVRCAEVIRHYRRPDRVAWVIAQPSNRARAEDISGPGSDTVDSRHHGGRSPCVAAEPASRPGAGMRAGARLYSGQFSAERCPGTDIQGFRGMRESGLDIPGPEY